METANTPTLKALVNLFHEIGMLAETPRSGFAFLGSGRQSVAEHSYRVALIALFLAEHACLQIDSLKLLKMCLLHDLPEARTGDLNYVNKRYVHVDLQAAIADLEHSTSCGPGIAAVLRAYEDRDSLEATLAHDADQLEMLLFLKREHDLGNSRAMDWFSAVAARLILPLAREVAINISTVASDEWWQDAARSV
jgi:putative hydrolase of HD superfamily